MTVNPAEPALRFLESDPRHAGADVVKQRLIAGLRHARLSNEQRNRVAALLLRALRHGSDDVFRSYARLAPAVTSPLFEAAVTCYTASCQYPVAERARHLLGVLEASREPAGRRADGPPRHEPLAGRHLCAARG